jgi:hypothetical protein
LATKEQTEKLQGKEFVKRFKSFFEGVKEIYINYMNENFPNNIKSGFNFTIGRRYVKVISGNGVYCFVDKLNGDVLKGASWSSPAKHARGNIFDADNGLKYMGQYGPAYLK